jgi:hypothetical protein
MFIDPQYVQFGQDISQFQSLLEQLAQSFENATNAQYTKLPTNQFAIWEAETHRQRQEISGEFNGTLLACQQLLEQNEIYLIRRDHVWDSAMWQVAGANDKSGRLKSKIKSHAAKVRLNSKCFLSICLLALLMYPDPSSTTI